MEFVMSRTAWGTLGWVIAVLLAVWVFFPLGEKPTPSEEYTKAAFTRPSVLPRLPTGFKVRVGDTDGLQAMPTVESGARVPFELTLPEIDDDESGLVFVVPRLPSQETEGFEWMDLNCDMMLGLNKDGRPSKQGRRTYRVQGKFDLNPDEYIVRYYLQLSKLNPEKGLPCTELLGEGRVRASAHLWVVWG